MEPEHIKIMETTKREEVYLNVYKGSEKLKSMTQKELEEIMTRINGVIDNFGSKQKNFADLEMSTSAEIIQNILLHFYLEKPDEFQDDSHLLTVLTQKQPDPQYYHIFEQTKQYLDEIIGMSNLADQYLKFCQAYAKYQNRPISQCNQQLIQKHLRQGIKDAVLIRRQNYPQKIYGETLYKRIYINTYNAENQQKKVGNNGKFKQLLKVYYFVILIHELAHYLLRQLNQISEGERSFDMNVSAMEQIRIGYAKIKANKYNITWDSIKNYIIERQTSQKLNALLEKMKPLEDIYKENEKSLVKELLRVMKNSLLKVQDQNVRASISKIVAAASDSSLNEENEKDPEIKKLKQIWNIFLQDQRFKEFSNNQKKEKICDKDYSPLESMEFFMKEFENVQIEEGLQLQGPSLLTGQLSSITEMQRIFRGIKTMTQAIIQKNFPELQDPFFHLFVQYRTYKSLKALQQQIQFYNEYWKTFPQMFKDLVVNDLFQLQAGFIFESYLIPQVAKHSRIYDSDVQILKKVLQDGQCCHFKQLGLVQKKKGMQQQNPKFSISIMKIGSENIDLSGAECGVPIVCRKVKRLKNLQSRQTTHTFGTPSKKIKE